MFFHLLVPALIGKMALPITIFMVYIRSTTKPLIIIFKNGENLELF